MWGSPVSDHETLGSVSRSAGIQLLWVFAASVAQGLFSQLLIYRPSEVKLQVSPKRLGGEDRLQTSNSLRMVSSKRDMVCASLKLLVVVVFEAGKQAEVIR